MSDIKESNIKDLLKGITDNLVKKSDGKYIFKSNEFQMSSQIILGHSLKWDPACIPSIEELGDYFEREIVFLDLTKLSFVIRIGLSWIFNLIN